MQKSGTHHLQGIFIATGPPVRSITLKGAKIVDLAPTILYLLGEEVPGDMDGRVLSEAIEEGFARRHPVRVESQSELSQNTETFEYSDQEEAYVREKLQGLGYVE